MPLSPSEKEHLVLSQPELWALNLIHKMWGWRNLYDWQRRVLVSQSRRIILNCSRQSGKSCILATKMLHKAITTPKALILIIAEQEQSQEDLRRVQDLLDTYNRDLRTRYQGAVSIDLITQNKTEMEFGNRARIISLASHGKRGYTAPDVVWFDEAAHDVPDEAFVAMEPMVEVGGGQLILSSTPAGTSGFYARELENPVYEKYVVPYTMVPHISKESVDRKRMLYGDAFVEQEYNCKLLDDALSLFTLPALQASLDDSEDVLTEELNRMQQSFVQGVELI